MKKKHGQNEMDLPPVRIEKLVHGGAGLGFAGGPIFIPLTAPGDLVAPMDVRRAKGVLFAEPGRILEPAGCRREPPCPWFGECGGCLWMHLDYPDQLDWKGTIARETLRRIGKFEGIELGKMHASPGELGYRYRARLHIRGVKAGFFRRRSNTVVDWDRCLLLPDRLNSAIKAVKPFAAREMVPRARSFEAAMSPLDGSITLNWIMNNNAGSRSSLVAAAEKVEEVLAGSGIPVLSQAFSDAGGRELISMGGALDIKAGKATLKASPGVFYQVNPPVNGILVERVLACLKESGARKLLDLFCGNGNFSIPAAGEGVEVEGVDSNPSGIKDAIAAGCGKFRFHAMDVGRFLDETAGQWDALIVDPPRSGLPARLTRRLVATRAEILVYISCEPASLARDLALLVKEGYVLKKTELFDMFPQTPHAEILAVLERNDK